MNDYRKIVTETAALVGVLDANGELVELDSLMVADFITALEPKIDVKIPMAALTDETFASIASITQMLTDLRAKSGA